MGDQAGYKQELQKSIAYGHIVKNGGVAAIREQALIKVEQVLRQRQKLRQVEKI